MKLGINGMGRIGKLSLWHHLANKSFSELVVNVGRPVGKSLADLAHVVEHDSTYGRLSNFLYGYHGHDRSAIESMDESSGRMVINGIPVRFLRSHRNPREIGWRDHGVRLVVDCTGVFTDPTALADASGGSLRGHLDAGAEKVLLSAPFKIKTSGLSMPEDAVTTVLGINDEMYLPGRHSLISAASCTTTCLAYMMKPMLDHFGADRILSASMVTVHASTSSQVVLDAVPSAQASDLRKNRSVMNNMILTTTGAAKALRLVLPEMADIGMMAESVRVPISAGSLIILTLNLQSESRDAPINRTDINQVYQEAANGACAGHLAFSGEQNVSADMIGFPLAAATIEGTETHTRTAYTRVNLDRIPNLPPAVQEALASHTLEVPVTQAVVYGWYDNEMGSYANMLGKLTLHIADKIL
ncbi:MAG: glyceraldehyde-3-phosphate dehydrogenase [Magnetococcales bacterium]|nr:glyceraldehyde-3-phosphate dehydrogenase [Magnetococcales bacterium]